MTIDLQTDGRAVRDGISSIRDVAQSMLDSEVPTKRQRSDLVKKAESLIALQKSVVDKIPDLIPADCTKYALTRLNAVNNYEIKTQSLKRAPREVICTTPQKTGIGFVVGRRLELTLQIQLMALS